MTSDQPQALPGTSGGSGQLPFDTSVAHQARMYDYLLGSYLAISHSSADLLSPEELHGLQETWKDNVQQRFTFRTHEQVARFFTGTDLVEPGLVPVDKWRAEPSADTTRNSAMWAAVGRKP